MGAELNSQLMGKALIINCTLEIATQRLRELILRFTQSAAGAFPQAPLKQTSTSA